MKPEMARLDLDLLKTMYQKEVNSLNESLLAGADWDEVSQKRKRIVEISIAIDKAERNKNPSEFYDTNEAGKP